jgi:TatA/E family protein of Tat protein translocase
MKRGTMTPMLAVLSATHVILVIVVLVLLFGAQKIPELMRSLGSGMSEFKKGLRDGEQVLLRESGTTAAPVEKTPVSSKSE